MRGLGRAVAAHLVAHLDEHELCRCALPSTVTSAIVDVRSTASPTRTGERNSNWLPAHMRRGSGTGGRKPPRLAWPSGPISLCRCSGRKYSQCHSGGSAVPGAKLASGWSSVALSAIAGVAPIRSCRVSLRPIQAFRSSIVVSSWRRDR